MQKFRVIFLQQAHDSVVAGLHEAGVVQLKKISELEVARKALDEEIYEISSLLAKFREAREFLGPPVGKPVDGPPLCTLTTTQGTSAMMA